MGRPSKTEGSNSPSLSINAVLKSERELLGLDADPTRNRAQALCLSGGGIRSATFCLGVLQGLAKLGKLKDFHYLSTVSGGTYIGAWLTTWIARSGRDVPFDQPNPSLPDGPRDTILDATAQVSAELARSVSSGTTVVAGTHEPDPIRRLRAYSSFLSPVRGLSVDFIASVAILARNLVLNWIVVVPILLAVLLLPRVVSALLTPCQAGDYYPCSQGALVPSPGLLWTLAMGLVSVAIATSTYSVQITRTLKKSESNTSPGSRVVFLFFVLPLIVAAFLIVFANRNASIESIIGTIGWTPDADKSTIAIIAFAIIHALSSLAAGLIRLYKEASRFDAKSRPGRDLVLHVLASGGTGAVSAVLLILILSGMRDPRADANIQTTFAVPLIILGLGFASILRSGISMRFAGENTREWWARASALIARIALAWLVLSMLVVQIPGWLFGWTLSWSDFRAGAAGTGGILLAIGTTAFGFWSRHGADVKEKAKGFGDALGICVFELAALASIFAIGFSASLLLGVAVARAPFMSDAAVERERSHIVEALAQVEATGKRASCKSKDCDHTESSCEPLTIVVNRSSVRDINCATPTGADATASHDGGTPRDRMPPKDANEMEPVAVGSRTSPTESSNFVARWLIQHQLSLKAASGSRILVLAILLILVGFIASALFGANAFSLNSFYGNRLVRAYLGASHRRDPARQNPFTGFDDSDNLPLKELAPAPSGTADSQALGEDSKDAPCRGPLLVVNTALNLIQPSGDRLEWQERKAASFFMTPYHCGSDVVNFVPTEYYGSPEDGLSVGRAMAISGAAASPSMGYHSSTFVSMLMAFFNVRLGWWMPNPARPSVWAREEPAVGLGPVMREFTSGAGDDKKFVYLSDGGHFENLGLYEMIRRRCRRILVIDAACDARYEYEDLENAIRKVRTDFGIEITFGDLPSPGTSSHRHFGLGRVHYSRSPGAGHPGPDAEPEADGEIVLIKPILTGDEPIDLLRYAETSRSDGRVFPQQPTSDQFFDEAQFESYRKLGLHSVLGFFGESSGQWPDPKAYDTGPTFHDVPPSIVPERTSEPRWRPEHGETAGKGIFSMLSSLAPAGQAAALASAITLTAAISVTGTVALQSSELTLKNPEVTLSPSGPLTASLDVDSGRAIARGFSDYFVVPDVDGGESRIDELTRSLKGEITSLGALTHVVKLELEGTPDPAWKSFIENASNASASLSTAIANLKATSGNLDKAASNLDRTTAAFRGNLTDAISNLTKATRLLDTSATTLNGDLGKIRNGLDEIVKRLGAIDRNVQSISPRQTVRGNGS